VCSAFSFPFALACQRLYSGDPPRQVEVVLLGPYLGPDTLVEKISAVADEGARQGAYFVPRSIKVASSSLADSTGVDVL